MGALLVCVCVLRCRPRVVLVDKAVGSLVASVDLLLARVTACQISLPGCDCAATVMACCIIEIPTRGVGIGVEMTKDAFPIIFLRRELHQAR